MSDDMKQNAHSDVRLDRGNSDENLSASTNTGANSLSQTNSQPKGLMTNKNYKLIFQEKLRNFWIDFKSYFNVSKDLESQQDIEESIRSGISFKGSQLLMLIFAIFIASLGLNTNSIPVIIGAMLISPLMGPIIGMGLAIGTQDYELLSRGFKNIFAAVIGSLLASALYFLISPQYEGASQLLARTSPSIYDVFVALFGGAAGILSIACKNKGQVMPGVAIATSLMPPLCTAGYGLATMQMHFFLGALYLFFTNMIFIMVATWVGVKLIGFKNVVYQNSGRAGRIQRLVYTVVFLTVGFSAYLTYQMIKKSVFLTEASAFVENQMVFPNTQVLNHKEFIENGKRYIDVTLIGAELPKDSLQLAMMNKLDSVGLGGTVLSIKQGFSLGTKKNTQFENADKFYAMMQNEISRREDVIDSLKKEIKQHESYSTEAINMAPEVKVLFPNVRDIAISRMVAASTANPDTDTLNMLFVHAPAGLSISDRNKLKKYVSLRLNQPNVDITLNPSNFPWPK